MLIYRGAEPARLVDHGGDERESTAAAVAGAGQKTHTMLKYSQIAGPPRGWRAGAEIEESPHH